MIIFMFWRYVLKNIRERLLLEAEIKELNGIAAYLNKDPVLNKLWDNKKDSVYDRAWEK